MPLLLPQKVVAEIQAACKRLEEEWAKHPRSVFQKNRCRRNETVYYTLRRKDGGMERVRVSDHSPAMGGWKLIEDFKGIQIHSILLLPGRKT